MLGNALLISYHPVTYQKLLFDNQEITLSQTDRKSLADAIYKGLTHHQSVQVQLSNGKMAFSEKEITHMLDVSKLLKTLLMVTIILLLLIGLMSGWLYQQKRRFFFYLPFISILLSLFLISTGLLTFSSSFTLFHELSFSNDFWLLDPTKDLLINLFPLSFFFLEFAKIGIMTLLELALLFFGLRMLKR
jgi:integral membrane protein (TIGR01906 family)